MQRKIAHFTIYSKNVFLICRNNDIMLSRLQVIEVDTYCRILNMRDFQFRLWYTLPFPPGNRRQTERGLGSSFAEAEKRKTCFLSVSLQYPFLCETSLLAQISLRRRLDARL